MAASELARCGGMFGGRRLQAVADALESFVSGADVLKVLPPDPGETCARLSADPLEVAESFGCDSADGGVFGEAVREAMEGLSRANFPRAQQARLATLSASLLAEALALRRAGVTPWALKKALRRAEESAEESLRSQAMELYAQDVLASQLAAPTPSSSSFAAAPAPTGSAACGALAGAGAGEDDEDELDWFFNDAAGGQPAPTAPMQPSPLEAQPMLRRRRQARQQRCFGGASAGVAGEVAREVEDACSELQRRCAVGASASTSASDGSHCFVYGSQCLRRRSVCNLFRGVICHVPRAHLVLHCRDSSQLPPLRRCIFIDADLTDASYASSAPAERRMRQSLVLEGADALLASSSCGEEDRLANAVVNLCASRGVEGIFMSGIASPAVSSALRSKRVVLVTSLPCRLLSALAAEADAEVLRGLPTSVLGADEPSAPWEGKHSLQVTLAELGADRRDSFFLYPLFGYRQPLLHHQFSVGEDAAGPCWEMRVTVAGGRASEAHTVILEARCEATLRLLHASLADTLHCIWADGGKSDEAALGAPDQVPGAGAWALSVASSLEATASAEAQSKKDASSDAFQFSPWFALGEGDALQLAAGLEGFAKAYRCIGEKEARRSLDLNDESASFDEQACAGSPEASDRPEPMEDLQALQTVVRRATRIVGMLVNLDGVL